MKMGDKVIVYGYIDGCSYETTGQTNYIIALETGERVEIPLGGAINADEIVFKDNIKLKDVIKCIKELNDGTRFDWEYKILQELGSDFYSKTFHEAYQQGKLEGAWVGNQLKDADKIRRELNKPVVQQFVADWYEEHKDDLEYDIWEYILHWGKQQKSEFYEWMNHANNKPFQTLANMHQFGYEVEREPKYTVKVKGICGNHETLNREKHSNKWLFSDREENSLYDTKFTRKELEEAGFGWVFDCEGIEIEEVEE